MTEAGKDHSRRLIGLAAKAFILASVAAVILPMLQSVGSLGKAQCIVWVARLSWMTSSCERRVFNANCFYGSMRVPNTPKNLASHWGWAGQAGAVTRLPST